MKNSVMAEDTDTDKNIRIHRPDYLDLKSVRDNNDLTSLSHAVRFLVDNWRDDRPAPAVSTEPISLTDSGGRQSDESTVTVDVVDVEDQVPLMAVEDLTLPNVDVYCPVCFTELCSLELDSDAPLIEAGMFREFTMPCSECGTERFAYQLVAIKTDLEVEFEDVAAEIKNGLPAYWDNTWDKDKSEESVGVRAQRCAQIAQEAGWDWRPPLGPWSKSPDSSAQTIMQHLRSTVQTNTEARVTVVEPTHQENTHDEWVFRVSGADSTSKAVSSLAERAADVLDNWVDRSGVDLVQSAVDDDEVELIFQGASGIVEDGAE